MFIAISILLGGCSSLLLRGFVRAVDGFGFGFGFGFGLLRVVGFLGRVAFEKIGYTCLFGTFALAVPLDCWLGSHRSHGSAF